MDKKKNTFNAYISGGAATILIAICTWCLHTDNRVSILETQVNAYSYSIDKSSQKMDELMDKVSSIQENLVQLRTEMKYKQDKNAK